MDLSLIHICTLFPLRAGEVTAAGTVTARAALPEAAPLIANFLRSEVLVEMSMPEVKITAQELPEGAPASFTNAVGDFRISASTDARDPVSYTHLHGTDAK